MVGVQVPAVSPVLFWRHCTQRPFRTCSRGGSPLHPIRQDRPGQDRSSSLAAVSSRCGCPASRPPGLRRAALRFGAGTFLSGHCGHRQPSTGSWTFHRNEEWKCVRLDSNQRRVSTPRFLGPAPLSAWLRTRVRPAGFGPANSPLSEECDWRIISPLRYQATLRAHDRRRTVFVATELSSAGRLLGRPLIAPPGFEPGIRVPKTRGIAVSPRDCSTTAKTGPRNAARDGVAHTSDVKTTGAADPFSV